MLRDYVSVAGVLGVRNFIIVSKTLLGPQLRLARVPRGPTLSFEINAYANSRDVRSSQRNAGERKKRELQPPLLIMNGFKGSKLTKHQEKHLEMVSTIFQNMFPALNINEVRFVGLTLDDLCICFVTLFYLIMLHFAKIFLLCFCLSIYCRLIVVSKPHNSILLNVQERQ